MIRDDLVRHLRTLLRARTPVLHLEAVDQPRALDMLRDAAVDQVLWTWRASTGLRAEGASASVEGSEVLSRALAHIEERAQEAPAIFVLLDPGAELFAPGNVRRVRDLSSLLATKTRSHLVVVEDLPMRAGPLDRYATTVSVPPPAPSELRRRLDTVIEGLGRQHEAAAAVPDEERDAVCAAARGLTTLEFENLLARAAVERGSVGAEDLPAIVRAKARILSRIPWVEAEAPAEGLGSAGGADAVKAWIATIEAHYPTGASARPPRPGSPRGLLLAGLPGAGKGHLIRAIAGHFGLPLVRLNGAFVRTAPPSQVRQVLREVTRMQPLVVWLDGLEDLLEASEAQGIASAHEVIDWLRGPRPGVLAGATICRVSALAEAHTRAPAFDRVFLLDLPDSHARIEVLRASLRAARLRGSALDLDACAAATDGFLPSEIEQALRDAILRTAPPAEPSTAGFLAAASTLCPIARAMGEQLTALRTWAVTHAQPAAVRDRVAPR